MANQLDGEPQSTPIADVNGFTSFTPKREQGVNAREYRENGAKP
jgi:hypothetical protein